MQIVLKIKKLSMESADRIRIIFKRIGELSKELFSIDSNMYQKFKQQISNMSDLEEYNFRKTVTDKDFEPIDTLKMRQDIIIKWEKEISYINPIPALK